MTDKDTSASQDTCPHCHVPREVAEELASLRKQLEELTEQIHTDALTKLYNYRHFSKTLDHEIERTHRSGHPTSLIMVDLDFFKKVNDTWGHEVGNLTLIQIATLLRNATRKLDIPCRYGGEEFALILPSTDLLTGMQVAERLRALIESTPINFTAEDGSKQTINITASIGVDVHIPTQQETAEGFTSRVDKLLYQAKQQGRNQVCHGNRTDMTPGSTVSNDEKDALFGLFSDDNDD